MLSRVPSNTALEFLLLGHRMLCKILNRLINLGQNVRHYYVFCNKIWMSGLPYLRRDWLTLSDMHIKLKDFSCPLIWCNQILLGQKLSRIHQCMANYRKKHKNALLVLAGQKHFITYYVQYWMYNMWISYKKYFDLPSHFLGFRTTPYRSINLG